jgi:hypothetical protein
MILDKFIIKTNGKNAYQIFLYPAKNNQAKKANETVA